MDLERICEQVCDLSFIVGNFIKQEVNKIGEKDVESKGLHNFVTYVDKQSQNKLIQELSVICPEAGYIAEETTTKNKAERWNWIIDPLDGTTNFIHGVPCYCISIALTCEDQLMLGVVYEINQGECFYAWKDSPAFLNGHVINVSKRKTLNDSLLATGFPYYDYKQMPEYLRLFEHFMQHTSGVRRLGSAAADLAYVACGRFEGFYEYSLSPWDVAAGALIVQQAGGKVIDFKGGEDYIFGKQIIATNNLIFDEMKDVVKKFFNF